MKNSRFKIQNSKLNLCILHSAPRTQGGIALIMVLWVIAILSVIVLEFCFAMRTEVNTAKNFKEEIQLYSMAEGGIQRAVAELIYKHDPTIQQKRKNQKPEEVPPENREWITDGRAYSLSFQDGVCDIRIMGEAGKIGINTVSEATLRKIIGQLGLQGEERDIVVDSIVDWRDPDDLYRVNGAENDYYQSLKEPYNCKNGNLDSIEELLLVRGITSALFYGTKGSKKAEEGAETGRIGLKEIFSVYSLGEQIDINSATIPALRIVLGIPKDLAQQVVKAREEKKFQNELDLLQRIPQLNSFIAEIRNLILYQSISSFYTIESRGRNKEKSSKRGLKAIVKIDSREKEGYKVIQWIDALI